MHGTIFVELRQFYESARGPEGWSALLRSAGLEGRDYELLQVYPDEEALALVGAASDALGQDVRTVLRGFGRFIAPHLLEMYWGAVQDGWRTLDVIEHAEQTIHAVVRIDHPDAQPPVLETERVGDDEIVLRYASARKMCDVAKGIAEGLATHYGEELEIDESSCMHDGAERCVIRMRRR